MASMLYLASLLLLFHFTITPAISATCVADERSALLQFKQSFIIDCSASDNDPSAYPKVQSWKVNVENDDCCSWDGVECDEDTSRVIGLDLSNSCLYGSINSSSSLFHLVHLHSLNLAYNHFNYSQIPFGISHLLRLTYLNLSSSSFFGQIPSNILQLSKLSFLDLSGNDQLMLKNPDFRSLLQNLTSLEELHLSWVDLSSTVPKIMANLSSLRSLRLSSCGLNGEFPAGVSQLPNLQTLDLSFNWALRGYVPEFNMTSQLQSLDLAKTSFSGMLPDSIGSLISLNTLDISSCSFSGNIPASFGNLTRLVHLDLSGNNFQSHDFSSLSWIGKQRKLVVFGLSGINLNGEIPSYFANLTRVTTLILSHCQITGTIPPWIMKMTHLVFLDLSFNQLQGSIPRSISQLTRLTNLQLPSNKLEGPLPDSLFQLQNLRALNLAWNNLSGIVEMDMFSKLKKLTILRLSRNKVSLLANNINAFLQKFRVLGLASCNLSHFPHFLQDQDELVWLDLSNNNIHGQIPRWLLNTMSILDLRSNMLQGSLPVPAPSIKIYSASNNNLTGEISPHICSLKFLSVLDLSRNKLGGILPECLGNFSSSLKLVNLGNNNFHGKIPHTYTKECNLRMLVLAYNRLNGQVPRSLSNCSRLELLILGNNQINDVFPAWLGPLKELKVLILRSNQFHSELSNYTSNVEFPKLRVIDLSQNKFSGQLPAQYFSNWNAMKMVDINQLAYMRTFVNFLTEPFSLTVNLMYSMSITNKGMELAYARILESFVAIDLSRNEFEGEIPKIIGNLNALRLLNLSNNNLSGDIPSSLGSLTKLESLDLSQNKLSGEIPQQLAQLHFLAVFNVSYNHLTGPIPRGNQFDTFENNSYGENLGLCGKPMSTKCGSSEVLPPSSSNFEEIQDSGSSFEFGWKSVLMGYGSGLLVGLVIGHIMIKRKYEWFLKIFRVKPGRIERARG
ncbi:receptor-like protein 7 [Hevea brasiliensis]|uniref:receptor-like protein 7 n=1 Tax=Hevea brasiliensis TaxID=3981 RepID=UPI0025DD7C21|nr:receptor-like protein 7 [Hevea brasiliensis]